MEYFINYIEEDVAKNFTLCFLFWLLSLYRNVQCFQNCLKPTVKVKL